MINTQNSSNLQLTWQSLLWRLILTLLLLLALGAPNLTGFSSAASRPDTSVLPTLPHPSDLGR